MHRGDHLFLKFWIGQSRIVEFLDIFVPILIFYSTLFLNLPFILLSLVLEEPFLSK